MTPADPPRPAARRLATLALQLAVSASLIVALVVVVDWQALRQAARQHIGGGIEYWFAYVLALAVLLVRPQGLFGERIIERI